MRVNATYRHVFEVTREVVIDDEDFAAWRAREADRGHRYDADEGAIAAWMDAEDTEFHAEVFRDWRTSEPLPSDFELQWSEVTEVQRSVS